MNLFPGIKRQKWFSVLLSVFCFTDLFSQTIIINEVSNGPSGNKEYIELVVVDTAVVYNCTNTAPPCIDIRGWIIDDNSGYHGGGGVAAGANRFSQDPIWACVPLGTIILIYNDADINVDIPAPDLSMSDGNCKIIAPISNTSFFETNTTTPGALACSYPPTGWVPGGNWASTLLANTGDCARIVDLNGCEVFSLCWASCNTNNLIYFLSGSSGTDNVWYFNDGDPNIQSNWSEGCTDPSSCGINEQTPGSPNNLLNQNYIGQFNNNCSAITPIIVNASSVDAACTCNGSAEALGSGSIPGYTYEWYDNSFANIIGTSSTINGLCAGTYHVIATSSIGCPDTATVVVNSTGVIPIATPNGNGQVCSGDTVFLLGNSSGTITYAWSGPNGFSSTQQNPEIQNADLTDEGTYTLIVTEGGCSSLPVDVIIDILPLPVVNISFNSPICINDTIFLNSTLVSGNYLWTGPNGFTSTQSNPEILLADLTDTGTYTLIVESSNCFSVPVDLSIIINEFPSIQTSSNSPVCVGDSIFLDAIVTGSTSFIWNGPNGFTSVLLNEMILNANSSHSGTYVLIAENNGCFDSSQITVQVINSTSVNIDNVNPICLNDTPFTLTADIPSGVWSGNGITNSNTGIFDPSIAGSGLSQIIYTISGNCGSADTIQILVNPITNISAGNDEILSCIPNSVSLNGSILGVATSIQWTTFNGNIISGANSLNPLVNAIGDYYLTITDANGCSNTDTVNVVSSGVVNALFNLSPSSGTMPLVVTTNNNSSGNNLSYLWTTCHGETSLLEEPVFTFDSAESCLIQLIVVDEFGCTDTTCQTVQIFEPHWIYIPNVFSPNSDSFNDFFEISGEGITQFHLEIYNRWGQQLFVSESMSDSWDGQFESKPVPEGTYYYIIKVSYSNFESEIFKGNLTLIRN